MVSSGLSSLASHAFVSAPVTFCSKGFQGLPLNNVDSRRNTLRIAACRRGRVISKTLIMAVGDAGHGGGGGDVGAVDAGHGIGSAHTGGDLGPVHSGDGVAASQHAHSDGAAHLENGNSPEDSSHKRQSEDSPEDSSEDSSEEIGIQGATEAPTKAGVSTIGLNDEETKFMTACYEADVQVIESMLDTGMDPNIVDVNKRAALHFCAGNGLPTVCQKLMDAGANINQQDILGFTPLHMATGYRKLNTVRMLVEAGADANIASFKGDLPVEIAENIFENTPEKKLFMANEMHSRMKSIVEILDKATELEDDDEVEEEVEEEVKDNVTIRSDGVQEITEEEGSTKFVVRVKPTSQAPTAAMPSSDVDVTIRVKEPEPKE